MFVCVPSQCPSHWTLCRRGEFDRGMTTVVSFTADRRHICLRVHSLRAIQLVVIIKIWRRRPAGRVSLGSCSLFFCNEPTDMVLCLIYTNVRLESHFEPNQMFKKCQNGGITDTTPYKKSAFLNMSLPTSLSL